MFKNLFTIAIAFTAGNPHIAYASEPTSSRITLPPPDKGEPEGVVTTPITNTSDTLKPQHVLIAVGFASMYASGITLLQYRGMVQERNVTSDAVRYRQLSHQANGNLVAAVTCGGLAIVTLPIGLTIEF